MKTKILIGLIAAVVIVATLLSGCVEETSVSPPASYNKTLVRDYNIVWQEDCTLLGVPREKIKITVPINITEAELKSTLVQVVLDETSYEHTYNQRLAAMMIFAYDKPRHIVLEGATPYIGRLIWSPDGDSLAVPVSTFGEADVDRTKNKYGFDIDL